MNATSEECFQRAVDAERKAATAKSENLRQGYLKIAEEWKRAAEEIGETERTFS